MDLKVTGKSFIKQESGLVIDEVGNKLSEKSVVFCKMTSFVITEEGDINNFTDGKMEAIYQVDDQHFEFFEGQVKELQVERSQSIITSVFPALKGSRHKTRRRQVTGMPLTTGLTSPVILADVQATTMPPAQVETAPEPLMPVPIVEVSMQPSMMYSQLGALYITNTQVHNDGRNVSICSLDSEAHGNLENHFNERLNDKVHNTFKGVIQ